MTANFPRGFFLFHQVARCHTSCALESTVGSESWAARESARPTLARNRPPDDVSTASTMAAAAASSAADDASMRARFGEDMFLSIPDIVCEQPVMDIAMHPTHGVCAIGLIDGTIELYVDGYRSLNSHEALLP